ncbi:MAG: hypothetical protein ACI4CE_07450 [Methanomethylophilus alvi]
MELNIDIIEKSTAHVVKMLEGERGLWHGSHPMYEGVCGWNGPMSPLNRPAFVAKFGEEFTVQAEARAKKVLADRANFWGNSKAKGYEAEADEAEGKDPASYGVGQFVWGIGSGHKCDHGDLTRSIRTLLEENAENEQALKPSLCKVTRIEEVDDIVSVAKTYLMDWRAKGSEGGITSDDVEEECTGHFYGKYARLTEEEKQTFYTLVVMVRDKAGRFFLIDPEGYDYSRYVLFPKGWKVVLRDVVETERLALLAEKKRLEEEAAQAAADRRAAYDARVKKWEAIMQPVPEGLESYKGEYRKIGKRNVAAMARWAFPWVRFSVSYDGGWGHGYALRWKNGPTEEEVSKACDFGLFCTGMDTFNGYDDSTGYERAEFTEFAKRFGGVANGVELRREECDHDRNGDPNGAPPKPPKPTKPTAKSGGTVEVKYNEQFNGLEIYFPAIPSEKVRNLCKSSGFRWSKRGFWYAKRCDRTEAAAEHIVAEWKNEHERAAA